MDPNIMNASTLRKSFFTVAVASCLGLASLKSNPATTELSEDQSKAVEALRDLEKRTGKTADELLPAIEIYANLLEILAEDLESGAVTKEELTNLKVISKNAMTMVDQDSATDAFTKLVALRSLNGGQVDELKKWLREGIVSRYSAILKREDEASKAYRAAVERESAKDEELAKALSTAKMEMENAQQGGHGQPATRPGLDSQDSDKPQPEEEGRTR